MTIPRMIQRGSRPTDGSVRMSVGPSAPPGLLDEDGEEETGWLLEASGGVDDSAAELGVLLESFGDSQLSLSLIHI